VSGPVILITGAGSGIGAAAARRLATRPGVSLLLHSRAADEAGRARLDAVAKACADAGASGAVAQGDLSRPGAGAAAVEAALNAFGRLDQIVHAAGFADRRPFGELARGDLDRAWNAMPGAFFDMATAALPLLAASPRGRVVVVSSFVARRFAAGEVFAASGAAKAALEALAKALATQLAPDGTTVNIVAPGYTRKDEGRVGSLSQAHWEAAAKRNPQRRLATQDDIAAAIAFLLSDEAGHITGQTIGIDGGLTLG
jgi:NAD(P)-dependent dehydrogenase (short-subunit alcohol dehydrogenase family)